MPRLIFALIFSLYASFAFAGVVTDLYQAKAPIASQSADDREKAAPDLLQQVILKVVGDRDTVNNADLSSMLKNADQYIQQFEYVRINNASADLTQPDQLALVLTFNKNMINQALNKLGLPIWDNTRPDVLLWLALDQGGQQSLLGSEDQTLDISQVVQNEAQQRGLPLLLPVMDLQDQTQLTFNDVWNGNIEAVNKASQRYAAPIIVTARITVNSNQAQIRWQSTVDSDVERWQSQGDIASALQSGLDQLVDELSQRYSQVVSDAAARTVSLQVSNVRNYADYARLTKYLSGLQYVSNVTINSLNQQQADLSFSYKGDEGVLRQTLAIGQVLQEQGVYDNAGVKQYRLLP